MSATSAVNQEAMVQRARQLRQRAAADPNTPNGIELALVTLQPMGNPVSARLTVQFIHANHIAAIAADPRPPNRVFPLSGGHRLPAGEATGQVRVTEVHAGATNTTLDLVIEPIGDFST